MLKKNRGSKLQMILKVFKKCHGPQKTLEKINIYKELLLLGKSMVFSSAIQA